MTLIASPEPATVSRASEQSRRAGVLSLLTALWLVLFFVSLFSPPVLDDADGTHANAARQIAPLRRLGHPPRQQRPLS